MELPRQPGALLEDRELPAALVQPGVGQRDGRMRREQPEQLLVPFGEAAGDALAGGEDDAEYVAPVPDRDAQEVRHVRVRRRPPLEPGIGADVVHPDRLALAQQHAEHAVLARYRPDRLLLALGYAVNDELGERPVIVGHAERRVPGIDERAGRPDDHLQHVAGGQLPGHREHYLADLLQHVVLLRILAQPPVAHPVFPARLRDAPRLAHTLLPARLQGAFGAPSSLAARPSLLSPGGGAPLRLAQTWHATCAAAGPDRLWVLGPSDQAIPGARPMCRHGGLPSVIS